MRLTSRRRMLGAPGSVRATAALLLGNVALATLANAAEPAAVSSTPQADLRRQPELTCDIAGGERHSVVKVIDGHTLRLVAGREVRLVGALAPSPFDAAADAGNWPLADAAKATLERLAQGRSLRIVTQGSAMDRYGRMLAHAFIEEGPDTIWAQGELLKAGHARAYSLEGSTACFAQLLACEAIARKARVGLWAEAAYRVRSSSEVRNLLGLVGTFQLIEGRVVAASGLRSAIYLNFGGDWRTDFTISIRSGARHSAIREWGDPAALGGRMLRVRGWIEQRGGPLIDIHHLAEIEWLDREPTDDHRNDPAEVEKRAAR